MAQKKIESTFTDPHGGNAAFEEHRAEAIKMLGDSVKLLSSTTGGVLNQEGTDTVGYKLTTVWTTE